MMKGRVAQPFVLILSFLISVLELEHAEAMKRLVTIKKDSYIFS
jgi:hypothetical protein